MENGDKCIQRVGVKEGRVSRTQYLFFQVYNNTKRCCWNISIPRECIGFSRMLLEYPYSYFLPLLSCFQFMLTILVCHLISFSFKHLPYYRLFIPFTYFLTINSPEKYIYMFGLMLSWFFFLSSTPMLYHLLFYHLPQPLEVWVTPRYSKIGDSTRKRDSEAFFQRGNFVNEAFTHENSKQHMLNGIKDIAVGNNNKTAEETQNNASNRRKERCIADEYSLDDSKDVDIEEFEVGGNVNTVEIIRVKQGVFHRLIATWTLRITFLSLSIGLFFCFFAILFPFGFNLKKLLLHDSSNGIGSGVGTGSIASTSGIVGISGSSTHTGSAFRVTGIRDGLRSNGNGGVVGVGSDNCIAGNNGTLTANFMFFILKYFAAFLRISPSSIFSFFMFTHILLISAYVYIYRRPVISRLSRILKIGCSASLVAIVLIRLLFKFASPLYSMSRVRTVRLFNDNYPNLNSFLADFNIKLKSNNLFYVRMAITSNFQYLFLFIIMVFISTYSLDIHQLYLSSVNAFKSNEDSDTYSLIKRGEFPTNEEKDSLQY